MPTLAVLAGEDCAGFSVGAAGFLCGFPGDGRGSCGRRSAARIRSRSVLCRLSGRCSRRRRITSTSSWEFYERGGKQAVRFAGKWKAIRIPMHTGEVKGGLGVVFFQCDDWGASRRRREQRGRGGGVGDEVSCFDLVGPRSSLSILSTGSAGGKKKKSSFEGAEARLRRAALVQRLGRRGRGPRRDGNGIAGSARRRGRRCS